MGGLSKQQDQRYHFLPSTPQPAVTDRLVSDTGKSLSQILIVIFGDSLNLEETYCQSWIWHSTTAGQAAPDFTHPTEGLNTVLLQG